MKPDLNLPQSGRAHWVIGGMDPSELQPTVVTDPEIAARASRRGMEVHGPFVLAQPPERAVDALLPYLRHSDPTCVSDVVGESRCRCGLDAALIRLAGQ